MFSTGTVSADTNSCVNTSPMRASPIATIDRRRVQAPVATAVETCETDATGLAVADKDDRELLIHINLEVSSSLSEAPGKLRELLAGRTSSVECNSVKFCFGLKLSNREGRRNVAGA